MQQQRADYQTTLAQTPDGDLYPVLAQPVPENSTVFFTVINERNEFQMLDSIPRFKETLVASDMPNRMRLLRCLQEMKVKRTVKVEGFADALLTMSRLSAAIQEREPPAEWTQARKDRFQAKKAADMQRLEAETRVLEREHAVAQRTLQEVLDWIKAWEEATNMTAAE